MNDAPSETSTRDAHAPGERRRRVLIVTSSYDPVMIADMQRVRMLGWELPRLGWDVEVLTPDVSYQQPEAIEPRPEGFFAPDVTVHQVPAWRAGLMRFLRIGSIAWRSLWPMYRAGRRLLDSGRFDLVYISTANFPLFCLGRMWQARCGVPYVVDLHDPWFIPLSEVKHINTTRWVRWHVSRFLAKHLERFSFAPASGLVSVSQKYIDTLAGRFAGRRVPWLAEGRHAVIPFAAAIEDRQAIAAAPRSSPGYDDGEHWHVAYVGAGGKIMAESMRTLCQSLARLRATAPELVDRLRIHLYGTVPRWQPGGARMLQEIATEAGVGELVEEQPARMSYRESLERADAARGLLVLGVDAAGYIPSKLFSYLLFGKPLLACFQSQSPALPLFDRSLEMAHVVRFGGTNPSTPEEADRVVRAFLEDLGSGRTVDRRAAIEDHLLPAMARRHAELFEAVLRSEAAAR